MSQLNTIQINPSCIFNVPFQVYSNDFSFIVNGKEFKTSQLVADLISPIICQIHLNDPTFNTFVINTSQKGNFSLILNLFNFNQNSVLESELPFLLEIIDILGNESIELNIGQNSERITNDNIFTLIKCHECYCKSKNKRFITEIDFLSSHFNELCESKEEEFKKISIETLLKILHNDKLKLNTEDQLLTFVNNLFIFDSKYSILYETVFFENVSSKTMKEFVSIFDNEFMNRETWIHLTKRLSFEIDRNSIFKEEDKHTKLIKSKRYIEKQTKEINFEQKNEKSFNGIINFLMKKSNGQIENEIIITSSSVYSDKYSPKYAVVFDDQDKYFVSQDEKNSWICFKFKNYKIIPKNYTIRTYPYDVNFCHPKSWVIECSNDNKSWEIVSEEKNCPHLNGKNYVHTFNIDNQNSKEYKLIRMRQTGPNYGRNNNQLKIDSFEINGKLIYD